MKRTITLMLSALLLATPLAGCGDSTPSESATPQSSTTSEAAAETSPDATSVPAGNINITHWEMMNGPATTYPDAAQGIVDRFNAENDMGITVTLQMTPWDNFYQTFLTAVTSGAAPDTSTGASTQPTQYAAMDEILDLTPIVEQWNAEGSTIPAALPKDWQKILTYGDVLTGIPWALDPRQITYRTDYFEQAGITEMPTTWEAFLDASAKIKEFNPDLVPFVFGGADHMSTQTMMFFLFQNNTGLTNENIEADFTNTRVIETLDFFGKLYSNGYISEGAASYKEADAQKMYASGTAAMIFGGPPTFLNDYPEINESSSVMPPMAGPSGTAQNYIWMNSIMGYTQTKEPEACRAFIKYWIEDMLVLWTEGQCSQIPSVSDYSKDAYFSEIWTQKEIAEKVIPTAVATCYPATSLYPAFSQIEGENYPGQALQAVISGGTDYTTYASDCNAKIAKALEDFGSSF